MVAKVSPYDFFVAAWPLAVAASKACGVLPEIIWAQAANETLYGLHAPQNNYFGIKGPGADLMTTEVIHGVTVHEKQHFAGYADMPSSFAGYAAFITGNERYRAFRTGPNIVAQLGALSRSGYATDPEYTQKIGKIAITTTALLARYNSIVGKVSRALSPKPIPAILPAPVVATPVLKQEPVNMAELSVAEKSVSNWLSSHATALTGAANLLKTVTAAIPVPAAQAVSSVISGLEDMAQRATTVAASVTTATAAVTEPTTLATLENTLETEAFQAASAVAKAAFDDLMAGKPVATIVTDAEQTVEAVFKGTSN